MKYPAEPSPISAYLQLAYYYFTTIQTTANASCYAAQWAQFDGRLSVLGSSKIIALPILSLCSCLPPLRAFLVTVAAVHPSYQCQPAGGDRTHAPKAKGTGDFGKLPRLLIDNSGAASTEGFEVETFANCANNDT